MARALLSSGFAVTRNPDSEKSLSLKQEGAELVKGDLEDRSTIDEAVKGASEFSWSPTIGASFIALATTTVPRRKRSLRGKRCLTLQLARGSNTSFTAVFPEPRTS